MGQDQMENQETESYVNGYLIQQGLTLPIGKEMMDYLFKCAVTNDIHLGTK